MESKLGNYELVSQLAVGGMAEIYIAKVAGVGGFEKLVALKVIHPNYSADPEFIRMLVDEAKLAVLLQHANIVQTFDLGCVEDQYYLTMELIDGVDLYRLLRSAAKRDIDFPFDVAAFITQEVCHGLDYAHHRKDGKGRPLEIVHRDVSPQNVMVSRTGEVKITDFGIAKASWRSTHTETGVIKGKYYYMSPEQAWGSRIDARSDVFSAGILLYEMIIGQMLYLEDDIDRLLDMVRKANIELPSKKRQDVPAALEQIVMKALRRKPEERYQSAGELASALSRYVHAASPEFSRNHLSEFFSQVMDPKQQGERKASDSTLSRELFANDKNSLLLDLSDEPSVLSSPSAKVTSPSPRAATHSTRELASAALVRDEPSDYGDGDSDSDSDGDSDSDATLVDPNHQRKSVANTTGPARTLEPPNVDTGTVTPVRPPSGAPVEAGTGSTTAPGQPERPSEAPTVVRDTPEPDRTLSIRGRLDMPKLSTSAGLIAIALISAGLVLAVVAFFVIGADKSSAVLRITSKPQGAEVRLDGNLVAMQTPIEISSIDPNHSHYLRISRPGYEVWESDVRFDSSHEVKVEAELVPIFATLLIETKPPGAEAVVNGRMEGVTPSTVSDLPPNEEVNVELRLRGYRVAHRRISFKGERRMTITVPLEKAR